MDVTPVAEKRRVLGSSSTDEDPTETEQRALDTEIENDLAETALQDQSVEAPVQTQHAAAEAPLG